jgi:hypothetical protein
MRLGEVQLINGGCQELNSGLAELNWSISRWWWIPKILALGGRGRMIMSSRPATAMQQDPVSKQNSHQKLVLILPSVMDRVVVNSNFSLSIFSQVTIYCNLNCWTFTMVFLCSVRIILKLILPILLLFFFFLCHGVWIQGFALARQVLYHLSFASSQLILIFLKV